MENKYANFEYLGKNSDGYHVYQGKSGTIYCEKAQEEE